MTTSSHYNDLSDFLTKHNHKKDNDNKEITHTRMPNTELKIYGAAYHIDKEELPTFYKLYYEHVFVKNRKEYLTEKQLEENGPILVDFDFRYEFSVTRRLHTIEHIQDIIQLYLEELKEFYSFTENSKFPIFIMEKANVNRDVEKQITKDGIHLIIGIQMDRTMQLMLRDRILQKIGDIWELPLKNSWDDVLDKNVCKGGSNWQMYGSQKPGFDVYKVSYYMIAELDINDNEWITTAKSPKDLDLSKDLKLLSAQYDEHVKFDINPNIVEEYNKRKSEKPKIKKTGAKGKINLVLEEESNDIQLNDIDNIDTLKKAVDHIMSSLKITEQYIKEIHEYTQILPEKYYEPGSHLLNRQVAFALKHTDPEGRLFLSWVMLRSKASDFSFDTIPQLYHDWKHHFNKKSDGVTKRSIMYWAKQDAFEEYEKVKRGTIDHYIEETIFEAGDWDYAMVLYHMFKDKYVCSNINNKRWYVFYKHRWERDEGQRLRLAISKDLFQLYSDKQNQYLADAQNYEPNDENHEKIQRKIKKIAEICIKLKKTNDKNNIMREAMEIFFDKDFVKNMDANPYLLCFANGVFDFKTKDFRQGYPQDYITKTTGIPYIKYTNENDECKEIADEIYTFMKQLFPQQSLCKYMWDHLASCLIGIKKEHAFNIYRGSGSNGKSILTDLMSQALGDYKGTVPITLVTEKRNSIGGTSSEVIQLKGVRYAVMQEPSKEAVINEGIMKELTGGDPIQARALYSDSEIFIPQFSLAVCTNALFEIKSNDDGTWRRMKLVDFVSKFISEGETHTDDTKYVFPKDKSLKEKLPKWAPVFIGMLVNIACETDGEVKDCQEVVAASNKYRQSQDCITGFISDKIIKDANGSIGKKILNDVFKEWFQMNYGNRKNPKLIELEEIMIKKFGNRNTKTNKWHGIKIKDDEENIDQLDEINM
uniref:SF3 helicase domain-containing protein n=1 Tax=viral metagenome TaxID=1070528 RepID=A0A6C0KPK3_9ZZZZ